MEKDVEVGMQVETWLKHKPVKFISSQKVKVIIIETLRNKKRFKLLFDNEALYIYKIMDEKEEKPLKFNYEPGTAFHDDVHNYLQTEMRSD